MRSDLIGESPPENISMRYSSLKYF